MSSLEATRSYYDEFSAAYEAARRPNDPHGYHAMLDDLEIEITERYGAGKDVLGYDDARLAALRSAKAIPERAE